MKYLIPILVAFCLPIFACSQNITGLWKGTMYNDSTKQSLPYEVFISNDNGKYAGFSHSWFLVNGKEYYGIKKITVRVAKDGKIIMQDGTLIENNYPDGPDKNVAQLNVLDVVNMDNEVKMDGPFATKRTKLYGELTGHISLKKVSTAIESSLMQYLQKNSSNGDVSVVK
jgi:hypothetical protein